MDIRKLIAILDTEPRDAASTGAQLVASAPTDIRALTSAFRLLIHSGMLESDRSIELRDALMVIANAAQTSVESERITVLRSEIADLRSQMMRRREDLERGRADRAAHDVLKSHIADQRLQLNVAQQAVERLREQTRSIENGLQESLP